MQDTEIDQESQPGKKEKIESKQYVNVIYFLDEHGNVQILYKENESLSSKNPN